MGVLELFGCPDTVAAGNVADGNVVDWHQPIQCTFNWSTAAAGLTLECSAYVAGEEGLPLGCVNAKLKDHAVNVAAQFQKCGIEHLGATSEGLGALNHTETIQFDLATMKQQDMFRYVFVRVGAPTGVCYLSRLIEAQVQVIASGVVVLQVNLASSRALFAEHGVIPILFILGKFGWYASHSEISCAPTRLKEESLHETLADFAREADKHLRTHLSNREEEDMAKVIAQEAQSLDNPASVQSMEHLTANVQAYMEDRNYALAMEAQEALIKALMDKMERDGGDDHLPKQVAHELARMDEILQCSLSSGASSSSTIPVDPATVRQQQNVMQAAVEVLDEEGYRSIAMLTDANAMRAFILRVAVREQAGLSEADLVNLAQQHSEAASKHDYESLVHELRATATLPGSSSGILPKLPSVATLSTGVLPSAIPSSPDLLPCPIQPSSSSYKGGVQVKWIDSTIEVPLNISLDGRPCAPMDGGVFIVPCQRKVPENTSPWSMVDMEAFGIDGERRLYPRGFMYWQPGEILSIEPSRGSTIGGEEVHVHTTDLGGSMVELLIDGVPCKLVGTPSATDVIGILPPGERERDVLVQIQGSNGNVAGLENGFHYFVTETFGDVGENIKVTNRGFSATRVAGVNRAICLSASPLRRRPEGFYFEIAVEDVCKSVRSIAVGMLAVTPGEVSRRDPKVLVEAKELPRVWLIGYDKAGSLLICDGTESNNRASKWRPLKDVKAGSRLGVLWSQTEDAVSPLLIVFQDNLEVARLCTGGRLPKENDDLFAVVDVQGTVRSVSFIQDSSVPSITLNSQ